MNTTTYGRAITTFYRFTVVLDRLDSKKEFRVDTLLIRPEFDFFVSRYVEPNP